MKIKQLCAVLVMFVMVSCSIAPSNHVMDKDNGSLTQTQILYIETTMETSEATTTRTLTPTLMPTPTPIPIPVGLTEAGVMMWKLSQSLGWKFDTKTYNEMVDLTFQKGTSMVFLYSERDGERTYVFGFSEGPIIDENAQSFLILSRGMDKSGINEWIGWSLFEGTIPKDCQAKIIDPSGWAAPYVHECMLFHGSDPFSSREENIWIENMPEIHWEATHAYPVTDENLTILKIFFDLEKFPRQTVFKYRIW